MALVTHQIQGSYVTLPSRPLSWCKGVRLKHHVKTLYMVGKTDRSFLLKRNSHLSVGTSCMCGPKSRTLRISAFKGSAHSESGGRASGPKVSKNSVKLKENEDITESPTANEIPIAYASKENETVASSLAIHRLFKKWLTLLQTQSSSHEVNGILGEEPSPKEISEMEHVTEDSGRSGILKAAWCFFLSLDVTIRIPLLMFIPGYLAVSIMYGAEVSKELTPLWVLGPLIVALYIKFFQWLFALYVFSFKQTVKIIKNLPTYCMVSYSYISKGKLKEDLHSFWQPVENIKNQDYKELSRRKLKELQGWLVEKYLDFVESIWPYYCRTIRFLKRANLI